MKFNQDFYPLPFGKYITFFITSDVDRYSFLHDVISCIFPYLNNLSITPIVIDLEFKTNIPNIFTPKSISLAQIAYLLNNSEKVFSFNDINVFDLENYVRCSSPSSVIFNDFTNNTVDKTKHTDASTIILAELGIKEKFDDLIYYGSAASKVINEIIPDTKLESFPNSILRLDEYFCLENVFGQYHSIITDRSDSAGFLKSICSKLYVVIDNIPVDSIKQYIDAKTVLLCRDNDILTSKRNEYIEYMVRPLLQNKRGCIANIDLSNCYATSNRIVWSGGNKYNSLEHLKKNLTFKEKFAILDSQSFWQGQDFIKIYKKHE